MHVQSRKTAKRRCFVKEKDGRVIDDDDDDDDGNDEDHDDEDKEENENKKIRYMKGRNIQMGGRKQVCYHGNES